jgi:hypothetical protein
VPPIQCNFRHLLPTVISVVVILGSLLSLVHARHLSDRDHGDASTGRSMVTRANAADVVAGVPATNMMQCPSPKWILPHQHDLDDARLDVARVAAWQSPAGEPASVVALPPVIPVARGPDLQAILQRFTL